MKVKKPKIKFKIQINEIKESNEEKINNIIKENKNISSNLSEFDKRIEILKEEKTTICYTDKKNIKEEKNNINTSIGNKSDSNVDSDVESDSSTGKKKVKVDVQGIINEYEKDIEKKIKEIKDDKLSYYEKKIRVLSELKTTTNYVKENINDSIKVDIGKINKEYENYIEEQIKLIKDSKMSYFDKKSKVLEELNTKESYLDITLREEVEPVIDIEKIKEEREIEINKKIEVIKSDKLSNNEKITPIYIESKKEIEEKENNSFEANENVKEEIPREKDNETDNDSSIEIHDSITDNTDNSSVKSSQSSSTKEETYKKSDNLSNNNSLGEQNYSNSKQNSNYSNISAENETQDSSIITKKREETKFNDARKNFYLKNNLYDKSLIKDDINKVIPDIYRIGKEFITYVYEDNLKTYSIVESGFINENISKNDLLETSVKEKNFGAKFYKELGLYFCERNIKIKNENDCKICKPDIFMCKDCMKLNKIKYNLNNEYLINIYGRITKINKSKYHCFGHFKREENDFDDCITKFECKACKQLNEYKDYYNNNV